MLIGKSIWQSIYKHGNYWCWLVKALQPEQAMARQGVVKFLIKVKSINLSAICDLSQGTPRKFWHGKSI